MRQIIVLLALLAVPFSESGAQERALLLNSCWPAFDYEGKPAQKDGSFSGTLTAGPQLATAQHIAGSKTMTAADGRLQIRMDFKSYKNSPAEEYSLQLTNLSKTEPTGIIAGFRSLSLSVDNPQSTNAVSLNVLRGSTCAATDFVPESFRIEPGKERVLATTCGRSSNDFIPFIELNLDDKNGYLFAVGWTGSWKARFANTGKTVNVDIGMERTNFRLMPGESIRSRRLPFWSARTRRGANSRRSCTGSCSTTRFRAIPRATSSRRSLRSPRAAGTRRRQ